tara:strand:- start:1832 stop:2599 length:768 start_codon:yes stop_codon:yes gene_type:complete
MTITNKFIANTNNQVLKQVLTAVSPLIAKQVEAQIKFEEKDGKTLSSFAIESIELQLIFDLVKSITSYTMTTDSLKEMVVGTSRKGNLEMSGEILRDGERHSFYTEAIIADGMINRRHLRYICKTSLPKQGLSLEAKELKSNIAKLNKVQRQEEFINTLEKYVVEANAKATEIDSMTDAEVADACDLLTNNWSDQDDNYLVDRFGTEEAYNVWLNECNVDTMERFRAQATSSRNRVESLNKSIQKETAKLAKLQA